MGEGPKTVIPSKAYAKLSTRLVCDQDPEAVLASLQEHFVRHARPGFKVTVRSLGAERPWLMDPECPMLQVGREAMAEAFGQPCALIRYGATVPVTVLFQTHLGVDPLMMGYHLPDARVHSPNEKFGVEQFYGGIAAGASLMLRLASQ